MFKKTIAISVAAALAAVLLGVGGTYIVTENKARARIMEVEAEATSVKDVLLGYTKYTDYMSSGKQVLTEKAKFLAATVVRDYHLVEHLQAGHFGLTSNATVIVNYNVEYSFGYELKADNFEVRATPSGIEVKLGKPELVASPAVTTVSHEIPSRGLLTDEKGAVIAIQKRLPGIAQTKGLAMAQEEPIRAICEKKLVEFLRDFLGKQPGVKHVPAITVVYK